ncbi:kinase-like protein [Canariomyces notabilis]|uniref:Kinase-like protein n=1 Tax=Canariomyces notabilis TaxID=2074819 RepID=A0AAN6YV65_9PEZI|nr:kinase-like protein [Canariomyces arenarius]
MSSTAVGRISWNDRSTSPRLEGDFLILPNKTVSVGRDDAANDVVLPDLRVSRCQLEIFCIIVDEECKHAPLVFVRDRGSSNGTCVNGQLIGKGTRLSRAKLLEDGDVITIGTHPDLTLKYSSLLHMQPSYTLSPLQRKEVELFKDRYIISSRTIGDGGHALVFLGTEVETGQQVVCKVHDISHYSTESQELRRIRQEATLLSTLDHPNILSIKAAFETHQTIYIITELATGGDLYSLLSRHDRLEEYTVRSIIRQVLRGVVYIHSKDVAHRDIKPENILCGVTPEVPLRVMLSDFGDSGIVGRQRMKSAVGTRFYRAPECYTPGQDHDLAVDIWAVGMLALQLFLGCEEFPGLDSILFQSQADVEAYVTLIFSLPSYHGRISEAGKNFIRHCLAYDSKERPTARQAFRHSWLQEPKDDRKLFNQLETRNVDLWRPQRAMFPVIQDLRAESLLSIGRGAPDMRPGLEDMVSRHFADRISTHPAAPGIHLLKER